MMMMMIGINVGNFIILDLLKQNLIFFCPNWFLKTNLTSCKNATMVIILLLESIHQIERVEASKLCPSCRNAVVCEL